MSNQLETNADKLKKEYRRKIYDEIIKIYPKNFQTVETFNKHKIEGTHEVIDLKYIDSQKVFVEEIKRKGGALDDIRLLIVV